MYGAHMSSLTKQQQYRAVSAGMALGLLMNNCEQIPENNKVRIELFFASAWRKWSHRVMLPSADTTISGSRKDLDLLWIMTELDSARKSAGLPFYWEPHATGGPAVVIREGLTYDLTDTDDLDHFAGLIHERIPSKAWAELAASFLAKLH